MNFVSLIKIQKVLSEVMKIAGEGFQLPEGSCKCY